MVKLMQGNRERWNWEENLRGVKEEVEALEEGDEMGIDAEKAEKQRAEAVSAIDFSANFVFGDK